MLNFSDWEVVLSNLVDALADAQEITAELAVAMRAEAHQTWTEAERLSRELKREDKHKAAS